MSEDKEKETPATPEETAEVVQEVADSVVAAPSKAAAESQVAVVDAEEEEDEYPIIQANKLIEFVAIEMDQEQLTRPCQDVADDEEERQHIFRQLHANMVLLGDKALGLSAIQIGIPKRAFVIRIPREDAPVWRKNLTFEERYDLLYFVNASVVLDSGRYEKRKVESCLSIPLEQFNVDRFSRVRIVDDTFGEQEYRNKRAQVILHEIDHTNGRTLWQTGERLRVEIPEGAMTYDDMAAKIDERREKVREFMRTIPEEVSEEVAEERTEEPSST